DPQAGELLGDLQLLLRVERDARRLLAVTQRRVEDQYAVGIVRWCHVAFFLGSNSQDFFSDVISRLRAAAHALFPLAGEEKKSKVEALRHSTQSVSVPASLGWLQRDRVTGDEAVARDDLRHDIGRHGR